ncbi:hypothetical protein [Streptomyces physcomitrii]|uniref:Uncharacterized protein n=1 Tax=Streptomyces physcomitrii TaxID=2724184 RepID=A0ABX1GZ78_9ACTN|nr:hypothetical protein [Streptomyces physcomitrii]NKI40440.1 hypothetical protein [Streptomyces physcomitrii]
MTPTETSQFVRLRVELVLEIGDAEAITGAALQRIADDAAVRGDDMARSEREQAESAVQEDEAEALAYLVDPYDLVSEVPGVELAQASWSSERIDYDPDSPDWDLDEDDGAEQVTASTEGADGGR